MQLGRTKHFRVAEALRLRVQGMKPGELLPTQADLMAEYQISQATVERALGRLRREGLIHRMAGKRRLFRAEACDPARRRVALIRPDYPSAAFDTICQAVVQAGRPSDWAMDLVSYRKMDGIDLARLIGDNDAAVLLPDSDPFPDSLKQALRRPRKPVVIVQNPPDDLAIPSVGVDDYSAGRLATQHLLSLGHRDIVCMWVEAPTGCHMHRVRGWADAMEQAGAGRNIERLRADCSILPGEDSLRMGYRAIGKWLSQSPPPFSGVFCTSGNAAAAAMRALREHGRRLPEEVSIIAYAGEFALAPYLYPQLTAVEVDLSAYGRAACGMLEELIADPGTEPRRVLIPPNLAIRASTIRRR